MNEYLRIFKSSESGILVYKKLRKMFYGDCRTIFVAAMPKSGSSFLARTLCAAMGYRHSYCAAGYSNIEQELYLPRLVDVYGKGTVVQQHVRANEPNVLLFDEFGIRPVVMIRNLFDVVMSVRDHMLNERLDDLPSNYPSARFAEFSDEKKLDYIVNFVMPWYVAFYASWHAVEAKAQLDFQWLVYDEIIEDWPETVRQVLEFQGLACPRDKITRIVDDLRAERNPTVRINKGVKGRGEASLNDRQKSAIVELTSYYPGVDFSRIGIP